MFIVSKCLLISSATVIVRTGGAIWLNPLATVLFNVCSSVTVVLCFIPVLHVWVWYVCCYVGKNALLQCLQLLSMGLYEVPCLCLCWLLGWGLCYPTSICCKNKF